MGTPWLENSDLGKFFQALRFQGAWKIRTLEDSDLGKFKCNLISDGSWKRNRTWKRTELGKSELGKKNGGRTKKTKKKSQPSLEMFSDLGKKVKKNDTELGDIFGPWKKNRNGAWKNFRNLEKTAKK